ncbi:MAG: hypothetical protein ABL977_03170 [Candidatus Eisenbacteria bacterium]
MPHAGLQPPPHAIRTRTCSLWLDGIIYGCFHDGAEVTGPDARENLAGIADFTRGRQLPVLVDLRPIRSQSAEARGVFAGPEATAVTAAVALVFDSPLTRVLGNFYLGFNRPETPTRLFNSVSEAEDWLRTFLPGGGTRG